jgi:stage II sporulation protein D
VVDLTTGVTLDESNAELLNTPVPPGSIAKIPALLAAFEAGVIDADTRIACGGTWVSGSQRYVCSHPRLERPLSAVDALAHSCNYFFATVAMRVPRAILDRAFLRVGLERPAPDADRSAIALGLDGVQATPRALLTAMVRALATPSDVGPWARAAVDTLRTGLREAARLGTAAGLGATGVDALAKTGTAPMPGGGFQGLVVAAWPAVAPSLGAVAVAPGAAGVNAADTVANLIRESWSGRGRREHVETTLQVGRVGHDGRTSVVRMPLEDYVSDVVTGEAAPRSSPAALEALAVTVRTYASHNRGRHRSEGYDLCDLTHCQVLQPATAAARAATQRTAGRVLLDGGEPANVFYTASCGGRSASSDEVWPGLDVSYLEAHDDPHCQDVESWTSTLEARRLVGALKAAGWRGSALSGLSVESRTASGRVGGLAIPGMVPPTIDGEAFRLAVGRALGWHLVKSTSFDVERVATGYRITGRGAGHGVGLCVLGSSRMAEAGSTRAQILAAYFAGIQEGWLEGEIASTDDPGAGERWFRLVLPEADAARYDEIASLVERNLDELHTRLGLERPTALEVRFHPTVESYQRETGRHWWTAAATSGHRIELITLSALERRGSVESTLRHELVHVLTEPVLAGRPLWVREGAAAYFSGEMPAPGVSTTCPTDDEFQRAGSADDLRAIYRRATACIADAFSRGVAWRSLGTPQGTPQGP